MSLLGSREPSDLLFLFEEGRLTRGNPTELKEKITLALQAIAGSHNCAIPLATQKRLCLDLGRLDWFSNTFVQKKLGTGLLQLWQAYPQEGDRSAQAEAARRAFMDYDPN